MKSNTLPQPIATNDRLSHYLENTPLGFIEWDAQLHVKSWSKKAEEIFGWTGAEFMALGKTSHSMVYIDEQPKILKIASQLLSGEIERNKVQHKNYTKDGRVIWCEWFNSVLKDDNGKVITIISQVQEITKSKEAEEKLKTVNRLYAFNSQVNQNIVHVNNEKELFCNSCRIALEFGKFTMAWIGLFDFPNKKIILADHCGIPDEDLHLFNNIPYENRGPQDLVLKTDTYYLCNDITNELELDEWKPYAAKRNIHSCMVLPIRKSGKIIGTFNLYSSEQGFSNKDEIALLVEVAGDISFALDIFEKERQRKQSDEAHLKSKANLLAIFENTSDGFILLDMTLRIISFNAQATQFVKTAFDFDLTLDNNLIASLPAERTEEFTKIITSMLEGNTHTYEIYSLNKNGGTSWFSVRGNRVSNAEMEKTGICLTIDDITERKASNIKLGLSEAGLKEAQAIAHFGNWEVDFVTNTHTWSDELYRILGITKEEGKPSTDYFLSFIHPNDVNNIKLKVAEAFDTLKATSYSFRFIRKDGTIRYGYTERKFEFDKNNNPVRLIGVVQDITIRKLAEQEREKLIADINNRNKVLQQFAQIVSHNLRAPVVNILGISKILKLPSSSEQRDQIQEYLFDAVKRLDEVTKDLNKILQTRSETSGNMEVVSLPALVSDIKLSIQHLIKKENVEIVTDFSAIDKITTQKGYLHSILYNLTSNSIKYRQEGIPPVIKIKSELADKNIRIIFGDNGMGIDLDKNGKNIFGLYKRFHQDIDGKGVGLFMVKTQVEVLGGHISVKSEPNVGTEFFIELPE